MAPWWLVIWWLCISSSGEVRKFDFFHQIWPWRSRSIATQNNRDLDQGILYLWSNLVIQAWMGDELWCGQAPNGVNFDFDLKFDLEGQGRLPLKTIGTLTKVFASLVQIWWASLERVMSYRVDKLGDGRTDGRRQRQYPKAKIGNCDQQLWSKLLAYFNYNFPWEGKPLGVPPLSMAGPYRAHHRGTYQVTEGVSIISRVMAVPGIWFSEAC